MRYLENFGYVKCVVPGCLVWTRTPSPLGMCPHWLWDNAHRKYYARAKGTA